MYLAFTNSSTAAYINAHYPQQRKLRDELSHNLFLMLQECNKFREHQAREILILTLEKQLEQREKGLELLKKEIKEADDALVALNRFCEKLP